MNGGQCSYKRDYNRQSLPQRLAMHWIRGRRYWDLLYSSLIIFDGMYESASALLIILYTSQVNLLKRTLGSLEALSAIVQTQHFS